MVTIECKNDECTNGNVAFFVLGFPERVMCGGCKTWLIPTNPTDDPLIDERRDNE